MTGIFPLLFVPAASGVMELGSQLADVFIPVVITIIPITALVMAVTGSVAQHCTNRREAQSHE